MEDSKTYWRKCTTCKKLIGFGQRYWICSVSTCNRVRTGLVFCSVECFDAHVPVLNHRDAGAYEKKSPTEAQWKAEQAALAAPDSSPAPASSTGSAPRTGSVGSSGSAGPSAAAASPEDILVVVSKVKGYIREKSGMNTSDRVMEVLSDAIRRMADDAIRRAEQNERKTVLDRDVR